MRRIVQAFLMISILFTFHANAEEETEQTKQAISVPNVYFSSDSEGFSTYKYKAGYLPLYEHGEKYTGITYQHNYFTQGGWSSTGEQYTLVTKAINPRTALGYNLNIGYNTENGHQLVTTDSNYGFISCKGQLRYTKCASNLIIRLDRLQLKFKRKSIDVRNKRYTLK
jgi:hypothetical protein